MKKIAALTLIAALVLALAACGSSPEPKETLPAIVATAPPILELPATAPTDPAPTNAPETEPEIGAPTEAPTTAPTEAPTEPTQLLVDGMRPEFKEAMDAYEAFYDEYCAFMVKYSQNPTDFNLLMQYAGMLTKLGEMDEAFKQWDQEELNNAELKYYLEVNNRVMQKMVDIMG